MTKRRKKHYSVACLAGHGTGPELMAETVRALHEVSRLHGFGVDDVHVPFAGEAVSRFGHALPAATRSVCLEADAILVATPGVPALEDVEAELDLRAEMLRVRFAPDGDLFLLSPRSNDLCEWTVEQAFALARASRARLASIDSDGAWRDLVDAVGVDHDGVLVEHLNVAAGLPALAFDPERFDVIVTGPLFARALADIAAAVDREGRVVARCLLAGNGPSVFGPVDSDDQSHAGQGVANPSSMLLAASLLLGHGLAERAAGETLAGAVSLACTSSVRTLDRVLRGIAATTREFTDSVLSELPVSVTTAEFAR
jgi:isocitrate/isopropylmalate dehydrogenase